MEWLNLHSRTLDSPEVVGSEPTDRGTWLMLLRFSVGQENGGRIEGVKTWKDRKCQQLLRVTREELHDDSDLWSWDGDDLLVFAYPNEKEGEVRRMRELGQKRSSAKSSAAKANGAKGGRPKKNPNGNPTKNPTGEKLTEPNENPYKGKEGKGIERVCARARETQAEQIVSAYPRREKSAEALTIVSRSIAEGEDPEAMLTGTRACASVIRSLPSGHLNRYVPSAVSFFRDQRWKDDPETLRRQGSSNTGAGEMDLAEAAKQLGGRAAYIDQ